jgi:Zn ribbon nucleic-acid-binding protein
MSVYRARTNCPMCNNAEEVWFYQGRIEPLEIVECPKCEFLFEPKDFICTFLEMRTNSTVSSSYVSL